MLGVGIGLGVGEFIGRRPSIAPKLDLNFASTKSLTASKGPTPSFSRASTGSYFDGSGVLRYQGYNLCQYSEDFTNAFWTKSLTSVSSNVAIAPNGQQTADKIIESASAGFHSVSNNTFNLAASSTASIYLKAGERGFASVEIVDNFRAVINLSDGTVVSNTLASSTVTTENAGNGWWRVKYTTNSSNLGRVIIYPLPTSTFGSYTGDGTSGIFAWGVQVETGATVNQYSQTTNSANSGPRFNHTFNGTSWVSRGLLVEEQRTNQFTYSEDFTNGIWLKGTVTVSGNQANSPDGNQAADLVYPSSSGYRYIEYTGTTTGSGEVFTWSIFAKAAGVNWIAMNGLGDSVSLHTWFNLSNGTIGTTGSGVTAKIENVGNGWYRCTVSRARTGTVYNWVNLCDADNSTNVTASGTNGVFFWGAQREVASFGSSYIPSTGGSSTTRSADVVQITGSDFSGLWNGTEGSVAVEFDQLADATKMTNESYIYGFQNAADTEQFILRGQSNGVYYWRSVNSGNIEATAQISSLGTATVKHAACYKLNDFASTFNGAAVVSDTIGATPNPTALGIGFYFPTSSNRINGHIARLRYFNKRLPNATLQKLST